MARVSAKLQLMYLREIYKGAKKDGLSLLEGIEAFSSFMFEQIKDGKTITQSTGAGYSSTWESPSLKIPGGVSPNDIATMISEFKDVYEKALNQLEMCAKYGLSIEDVLNDGVPSTLPPVVENPSPVTDDQIEKRMEQFPQFLGNTESRNDYWYQRCGGVITI